MTDRWMLVCVLLVAAGIAAGWLLGHWRAYAECCDCCTCQTCTEKDGPDLDEWEDDGGLPLIGPALERDPYRGLADRRHAVVLEPGPTIYPALAELAGEVMDEPESHPQPVESTWLRIQLVDWERRYPIPVGAP